MHLSFCQKWNENTVRLKPDLSFCIATMHSPSVVSGVYTYSGVIRVAL